MRVLLDHNIPKRFKTVFSSEHEVKTAFQVGLSKMRDPDMLAEAAKSFDVVVTVDKKIKTQANIETLPIPVVELDTIHTHIENLRPLGQHLDEALEKSKQCRLLIVSEKRGIEPIATIKEEAKRRLTLYEEREAKRLAFKASQEARGFGSSHGRGHKR